MYAKVHLTFLASAVLRNIARIYRNFGIFAVCFSALLSVLAGLIDWPEMFSHFCLHISSFMVILWFFISHRKKICGPA